MTPEQQQAFDTLQSQVDDLSVKVTELVEAREVQQLTEPLDTVSVEILKRQLGL